MSTPSARSASAPIPSQPHSRGQGWLRRYVALSWVGFVLPVGSLWLQHRLGQYHGIAWLWLPAAIVGLAAGAASLLLGLWKAYRAPRRVVTLGWTLAGVFPLLLWAGFATLLLNNQGPLILHKIGRLAGTNVFELHARLSYPHRLETDRLIMYYDDGVTDPTGDAAAMEAHLARLEKILGQRQRVKIHWIRGGPNSANVCWCVNCVAVGEETSPLTRIDRHEVAHALLFQFTTPDADPPTLLIEGWARAVEGHPEPLATTAVKFRHPELPMEALLAAEGYHRVLPWSYSYGGALVDYLIRHYGAERFLELYNTCRSPSFPADFQRVYGMSFAEMEKAFWREMESAVEGQSK